MPAYLKHGGALDAMKRAFPKAETPWIDLSTGINPWPYPVRDIEASHLPTKAAHDACRKAMAADFGSNAAATLPTPGSSIIISLLPHILSAKSVAIMAPTYGDYARAWSKSAVRNVYALSEPADILIVCRPNNPDGRVIPRDDLIEALKRQRRRDGWLIVDEAYMDLTPQDSLASLAGQDNLIVLRSFGKFYGLAGMRLGALLAPRTVLQEMSTLLGEWPISAPALQVGVAAYTDPAWQAATQLRLASARARLDPILEDNGLFVVGGTDLFRYAATENAMALWQRLGNAGISIRRFDWTERYVRIGLPPDQSAEQRLADALMQEDCLLD
ncbi:MAG: threonine-phosphate decarboxylase CobD [Sphingomonadales bacterium]